MIDTHCHLDATRFDEDRTFVLERAWAAGLQGILIPGVGTHDWEPLLELSRNEPRIQVGLGIHPQLLPEMTPEEDDAALELLDALLSKGGAVAVGECGLDGPSLPGAPLERQVSVLQRHLALARKHQLPVLMHCHRLHPALIELLKQEQMPEAGLLMHSYSGGVELARFYLQKGCHFSFAGPVTWAEARKPLDALRAIPLERLMAETDAPDQAPTPHRGGRSEPAYLPHILEGMARVRGEPLDEVAQRTTENARRLFREGFPPASR
ncbi:TatD family deoxyribonuclease [Myxococcus llanfairpwllgwyngyllgogerychwyrndrobwllllantysiliogogogochensis]|uniref:TatD family deoxyribonuclease n=1 Tax=Myxococcus llanfairpwllgwyngyllgogerychwyrndrobwllllantysiliogogogochensis TaxID=2590453 RepID=A0A540WKY1_9BACT|nr:TatD family hydrolase [Myxococcus llanfairpwllgwyngyllgogerychwyrndrobwllllantysiliogogogochensis]TQF09666.1 TatD family deoxyribonuclease [Myxococcus llanfairpwllgwyngyllgogerychwyrndrobwllllantysiliogogogochensis]